MASMIVDADAGRRSESDADVEDDDRDIAPPGDEPEPDAQPDRQPDAGRRISTNPSSTDFFIFLWMAVSRNFESEGIIFFSVC